MKEEMKDKQTQCWTSERTSERKHRRRDANEEGTACVWPFGNSLWIIFPSTHFTHTHARTRTRTHARTRMHAHACTRLDIRLPTSKMKRSVDSLACHRKQWATVPHVAQRTGQGGGGGGGGKGRGWGRKEGF